MDRQHWLVKSEPFKYAWDELVEDGSTYWDGVRNYEARNNLRSMKVGDLALYYHSNEGKEVVGVARITREAYPDPTTDDEAWVVVELEPVQRLEEPVSLADVKAEPALSEIALVRRGRISVVPITEAEFERILAMGSTTLRSDAVPEKLPPRPPRPRARRKAAARGAAGGRRRKAAARKAAPKRKAAKRAAGGKAGSKKQARKKAARKKKAAARKRPARKKTPAKRAATKRPRTKWSARKKGPTQKRAGTRRRKESRTRRRRR